MYGYTTFHTKIASTLTDNARSGNISHAYIFEGAKGMYKTETARLFANAIICENRQIAPCGECHACREAAAKTSPDIIFTEHDKGADGKPKKTIGVEAARRLCDDAAKKPYNSSKKIYIIPDGENMTAEAQNALLKTFEEPPEYVVIIIIVPSASLLLPTIVSRASVISFNQVPSDIIRRYITEKYPEKKDMADFLVRYCEGIPGNVDKIVLDEEFENLRNSALTALPQLISSNIQDAFKVQKYAEENKDKIKDIVDIWISFLRDVAVIHCGASDKIINSDREQTLRGMCSKIDLLNCVEGIHLLTQSEEMLSRSVKASAVILRCALLMGQKNRG